MSDEIIQEPRRVSFSQYAMWATCPKQWKLAYHDKLKPNDPSIHTVFGTAIHETVQEYLRQQYGENPKRLKFWDITDFFKDALLEEFKENISTDDVGNKVFPATQAELTEAYTDGVDILNYFRKHVKKFFPDKSFELVGIEVPLEIPLRPNVNFIGYIDLVIRDSKTKHVYIFDLKTSKKGWYYEKKDPKKLNQLLLYKRFFSEQFGVDEENITVEFLILKRKVDESNQWNQRIARFEPSHGTTSVKRAVQSFHDFLDNAFNENGEVMPDQLIATPGEKNCRFCFFKTRKDLCPDGVE